ncbi:hypothetical protein [Halobacillus salinus]|uniref:hypothetical protein n=1 Tax=Halobacillus salinus TaxID=192814 RepID=UPI0009A856B7|nr:hypothetical protein [Halobacillus salinus]
MKRLTKKQKLKYLLYYPLAAGVLAFLLAFILTMDWMESITRSIGLTIGFFIFWWGWALLFPQSLPENQNNSFKEHQLARNVVFYVIILVLAAGFIWIW